ncbi:MAG: hypothetical protein JWM81_1179 [Candidatus Saccharibacteria bacterium]|nr:hypothetical protein [Candidatus Saccharibacteria bacterium]
MTNPEREAIPQFACEEHGEFLQAQYEAGLRLQELFDAGFSDEDIQVYAEDDPELHKVFLAQAAAYNVLVPPPNTTLKIRSILRSNKTTEIWPLASAMADTFVDEIGYKPDGMVILGAVMFHALAVSTVTQTLGRKVNPNTESAIVNTFGLALLARSDKALLCGSGFDSSNEESLAMIATTVKSYQDYFAQVYPMFQVPDERFLAMKIQMHIMALDQARELNRVGTWLPKLEITPAELHEQQTRNTEFAKYLQRIRRYGIKDISFPAPYIYSNGELVFSDAGSIGQSVQGEQPLARVKIVDESLEPAKKFGYEPRPGMGYATFAVAAHANLLLAIDSKGELHAGLTLGVDAMPLRDLFEQEGRSAEYEFLRTRVLSELFDTIAPATIVKRLNTETTDARQPGKEHEPSDVVYTMPLARIRYDYLQANIGGKIKKDFDDALEQEKDHLQSELHHLRLHDVTSHLRRIPDTASPSERAIGFSKQAYGEDYIIPEGYTFVRKHERGSEEYGRVLGHNAVKNSVS